ncbi:MAG TPA: phasin family protein [Anaeromyxobacter sp.]|jgi:DNA-binding transcriptional MerR regulator|nr:phasin family protein [Anaeromyxobacter sp.]
MAEVQKTENGMLKVPEFLREPLVAAQARIGQIEEEAQRVLKDLVHRGRASRKDLEEIVHRLSRQDFSLPEVKHRLEKLRDQGAERAAGWRDRAESFRSDALERMLELQARAVQFLGVATREEVQELSRELDRLAKRFEKSARRAKRAKASGEA